MFVNKEELINKLVEGADFKSQFLFMNEEELKEKYGDKLFLDIRKEFFDHWSYELTEKLESIDIKALIADAVNKAMDPDHLIMGSHGKTIISHHQKDL